MMIRNMAIEEFNHLFQAGYIKEVTPEDIQDLLDFIGRECSDQETAALRELQQEYDKIETDNEELKFERKEMIKEIYDLQEKLRKTEISLCERETELKQLKTIPAVRDALKIWVMGEMI